MRFARTPDVRTNGQAVVVVEKNDLRARFDKGRENVCVVRAEVFVGRTKSVCFATVYTLYFRPTLLFRFLIERHAEPERIDPYGDGKAFFFKERYFRFQTGDILFHFRRVKKIARRKEDVFSLGFAEFGKDHRARTLGDRGYHDGYVQVVFHKDINIRWCRSGYGANRYSGCIDPAYNRTVSFRRCRTECRRARTLSLLCRRLRQRE